MKKFIIKSLLAVTLLFAVACANEGLDNTEETLITNDDLTVQIDGTDASKDFSSINSNIDHANEKAACRNIIKYRKCDNRAKLARNKCKKNAGSNAAAARKCDKTYNKVKAKCKKINC